MLQLDDVEHTIIAAGVNHVSVSFNQSSFNHFRVDSSDRRDGVDFERLRKATVGGERRACLKLRCPPAKRSGEEDDRRISGDGSYESFSKKVLLKGRSGLCKQLTRTRGTSGLANNSMASHSLRRQNPSSPLVRDRLLYHEDQHQNAENTENWRNTYAPLPLFAGCI